MNLNDLNLLPEWDEDRFKVGQADSSTGFNNDSGKLLARAMYNQWREVFGLVMAFAENLADDGDQSLPASTKALIYENLLIVAPKIMGAISVDHYVLKMENAANIRTNAKQMMQQIGFAVLMGWADELHRQVIENALNQFKQLFKQWVATFQKDHYEDEWGLFV
ncbi:MAG: hypothetical protein ACOVNO_06535 [Sediminibacterium sp.]